MELSPKLYHYFVRPKWFSKIYIDNVINENFQFKNKLVLDFGSGTGSNSSMFDSEAYIGVDIDPARIQYARRLYPNHRFDTLKDNSLPVDNDSVDYVLIVAVLHHIPDVELPGFLSEFQRILKPNGKVLVLEPCYCEKSNLNNRFMTFFDNGKFIRFEDDYLGLFKKHQFKTKTLKNFKKLFYNEVFFYAQPSK